MNKLRYFALAAIGLVTVAVFTACGATQAVGQPAELMRIVEKPEGFLVKEGDKDVLFYRREAVKYTGRVLAAVDDYATQTLNDMLKDLDAKSRPHYVHPLYGLDGEILTEDFPRDHLHHHGIFWAWHQVYVGEKSMGDGWEMKDLWWDIRDVQILETGAESAALKVKLFWKSPHWTDAEGRQKPFIEEVTVIRVHSAEANIRKIDFEIGLLALEKAVRIGGSDNKKGYGGFSPRLRIPKTGLTFIGTNGPVKPQNTPVEGGPWLDFSGDFRGDGRLSGVAVLCHKSILGYPRPWILRRQESMQNPVFPGREPVGLSRDKPLVLRYRLILHRGDVTSVDLDKLQAQYNAE